MTETPFGHQWGAWSEWAYACGDQDTRHRACTRCPAVDPGYRRHAHQWKEHPDVFAPVGTGATISVCSACRTVKGS
ncbi:MAG TPA: hypothetical protein VGG75_38135 [Trebonia sp.]|jgi:hypothetical protein